ncbi:MAG: hypothetical protein V4574_17400 [Pseudomonadota bacterium]
MSPLRHARPLIGAALLLLCLATPGVAIAQEAQASQDIVVTAQNRKALNDFVAALADAGPTGQVARWKQLCPAVVGIPPREADFIVARIGDVARSVRVDARSAGCRPTTLILVTMDAHGLAAEFARRYPVTLRTDGRGKLRRFVETGLPVRWLSVTDPCPGGCALPNSRLVLPTHPTFQTMVVIVDARQIAGFSLGELADYLALVALANPPLAASKPSDSILAMFQGPHPADRRFALTAGDQAFLDGLYRSAENLGENAQRGAIATHIKRERRRR